MWMGELISQRGIGNGMSLLIFASVVSSFPGAGARLNAEKGTAFLVALLLLAVLLLVAIVFIEQGQRRIPVQFAKRVVGRRMYGGQSTYIPLKVNQSGVIPIIFASSVLYLPILLTNVLPADGWGADVQRWINDNLVQPDSIVYVLDLRPADHRLRVLLHGHRVRPGPAGGEHPQAGRVHPGHPPRAPRPSATSPGSCRRITLPGALFIAFIALLPSMLLAFADVQNFPFAGTSILIAVGVALETMKQIDSQLMMRNYEGFLK